MMTATWGFDLFGVVDRVPKAFFVATVFFHVMFFPLVPIQTYIVIENPNARNSLLDAVQGGDIYRVPIKFSWMSIGLAYLRAVFLILGVSLQAPLLLIIVSHIYSWASGLGGFPLDGRAFALSLVGIVCLIGLQASHRMALATPERAAELAEKAGFPLNGTPPQQPL